MTRLFSSQWVSGLLVWCLSGLCWGEVSPELVQSLNPKVLRIQVSLSNGSYGLGSGVVVAENQVVTNCHVVANATSINVVSAGASFNVTGIKPDWQHDVCVLQTEGLPLSPVAIKASRSLNYEQTVFNIGYPSFLPMPVSSQGVVKGLFTMDDSVVVRATSRFKLGASGGGLFDEQGNLVGIITLKSPGHHAYYYYMSTEWVQALLAQPAIAVVSKSALPFWAKSADLWPNFMKVVHPYLTEDWPGLYAVAKAWVTQEPNNNEAWFYLAAAEYGNQDWVNAEKHLYRVIASNKDHSQAFFMLGMLSENTGKHHEAIASMNKLEKLDATAAGDLAGYLKVALKVNN